jgi:hypothetical protein
MNHNASGSPAHAGIKKEVLADGHQKKGKVENSNASLFLSGSTILRLYVYK